MTHYGITGKVEPTSGDKLFVFCLKVNTEKQRASWNVSKAFKGDKRVVAVFLSRFEELFLCNLHSY